MKDLLRIESDLLLSSSLRERSTWFSDGVKRFFDLTFSGLLLVVTSPLLLILGTLIRRDGGPALYRQTRAGWHGQRFEALKFRSMRVHTLLPEQLSSMHGQVTSSHPMVTPIGRWIRRFKLDELPQLFNVFNGDMSLVGPRPTIPEQVEEYTWYQMRRLDVRPGMSGWAQVNGGIELTWPERITLDVWYVAHRSFWFDCRILLHTFQVVFLGETRSQAALQQAEEYARQQTGMSELLWPQA